MTTTAAERSIASAVRSAGPRHRLDIQGMRAVAVLLVIANHLFSNPSGGFVGVDVFFVISGYLITGVLLREGERDGRPSLREFYARRVRRIIPVAVLVLVATNAAAREVFSPLRVRQTQGDSLWALLFGANVHFSQIGTDYFELHRPPSAVQHYWSLSVEEQFYLAWPLLVIIAFLLARRVAWHGRGAVLLLAMLGTAGSLIWCLHETSIAPNVAYFSTAARSWELGLGAVLAISQPHLKRLPGAIRAFAAWAGIAGIAAAAILFTDKTPFPGSAALLPVVASGLILAANDPTGGPGRVGLLNNPVSQFIGKLSYSLYLWHFPCIILAKGYFATKGVGYYLAAGVAPFALSVASFYLLESPIRGSNWLSRKPAQYRRRDASTWKHENERTLVGLLAALIVIVTVGGVAALRVPASPDAGGLAHSSRTGTGKAPVELTPVQTALHGVAWGNLTPAVDELPNSVAPQWNPGDCLAVSTSSDVRRCVYGDKNGRKTVAVIGDSMAVSWMPGLVKALPGWRIQMLTFGRCPFVDVPTWQQSPSQGAYQACIAHRASTVSELKRLHADLIIDSGASHEFVTKLVDESSSMAANFQTWQEATRRSLTAIKGAAPRVVLLGAPPGSRNLQECYTPNSRPQDCVSKLSTNWVGASRADRNAAAATAVTYINPLPWVCDRGSCPAAIDQIVAYWDGSHLTREMSEHLALQLRRALA